MNPGDLSYIGIFSIWLGGILLAIMLVRRYGTSTQRPGPGIGPDESPPDTPPMNRLDSVLGMGGAIACLVGVMSIIAGGLM